MKIEIPLNKASRIINSGQVILATSCYKDKRNIITLAWSTPLSRTPALVGISIAKTHLSAELIRKSEEFIINVPTLDLLDKVMFCGKHSGREVDKFSEAKLTARKAERLTKAPLIAECIGHLECYLRDVKEAGDHFLFIGEVIYASAEENLFDEVWDVNKVKLIYHLGGKIFTSSDKKIEGRF